jgi:hypothetical protein
MWSWNTHASIAQRQYTLMRMCVQKRNLEDSTKHGCAGFYSVNNRAARCQGKQLFFGK